MIQSRAESIERFMEGQAFSPSYDLAHSVLSVELTDGRWGGGGAGEEPKHRTAREKAWSSINHFILSGKGCSIPLPHSRRLLSSLQVYLIVIVK